MAGFDRSALGPVIGGYDINLDDDILKLPEGYGMERTLLDRMWFNTGVTFATGLAHPRARRVSLRSAG